MKLVSSNRASMFAAADFGSCHRMSSEALACNTLCQRHSCRHHGRHWVMLDRALDRYVGVNEHQSTNDDLVASVVKRRTCDCGGTQKHCIRLSRIGSISRVLDKAKMKLRQLSVYCTPRSTIAPFFLDNQCPCISFSRRGSPGAHEQQAANTPRLTACCPVARCSSMSRILVTSS